MEVATLLPILIGRLASNSTVYSQFDVSVKHSRLDERMIIVVFCL